MSVNQARSDEIIMLRYRRQVLRY